MIRFIKQYIQHFIPKKSGLYKYIRGKLIFNSLESPRPMMVKKNFQMNWNLNGHIKGTENEGEMIYLVSPMQRSGTNYLHYLISLHPNINLPEKSIFPPEQFLLTNSNQIKKYINDTIALWNYWVTDKNLIESHANKMMANLGAGLLRSMKIKNNRLLLLKTPDSYGIENFFYLFPQSKLIILTRDGRDTIESYMKSWGGRGVFKALAKRWNDRVQRIQKLKMNISDTRFEKQICIVDYQKLNTSSDNEIRRIIRFLGLSEADYNYAKMASSPVLGSSELRGESEKVNWEPISKPKNFNLNAKWQSWTKNEKRIFKKYAGKSLIDMGYEQDSNW